MKTMHLFAGAGGGLLADLILGHDPIIAVELDRYACQVLRERAAEGWFPNLSVWEGDIRMFNPSEYAGKVDCIHAGFPCQDISVAGKQAGVGEETRSGLYREVLRIAGVVRPKYLFIENVAAIVTNGLGTVLADITSLGYDAEWLCLRASDCGAKHHRDRWWLFARWRDVPPHTEYQVIGWRKQQQEGISKENGINRNTDSNNETALCEIQRRKDSESSGTCGTGSEKYEDVAYSYSTQCEGNKRSKRTDQEHADISGRSWWDFESDVGRVANGVACRVDRLKAIGNGQVPLQAAVAWKLLGGG